MERRFMHLFAPVAALALLLAACAPAAPSPTAAPPKPTEAPKPAATTAPAKPAPTAAKPAAKPATTASPVAKPSPAASPAAKMVSLPRPEVTSLKLGVAALETNGFTAQFANDLGLYKKYGIENVEILYFEGAARALQAGVAGQVQGLDTGAGSALSSVKAGSPLHVVAMYVTRLTDNLVSVPGVTTPADLKGKTVAVSTFGGDSHAAVLMALKGIGLTDKDVTVQQIGGQSARIAALKAGSIAAAPVDVTLEDEMRQQGFNILISLPKTDLRIAKTGLMFPNEFIQKNPNTVLAVVAANLEAMQRLFTDTDRAVDSYAKWTQMSDRNRAEQIIRDFLPLANRDLRWTKEAFDNLKDVLVIAEPDIKDLDVSTAYTFQFLDKLRDMGFDQAVGVPKM